MANMLAGRRNTYSTLGGAPAVPPTAVPQTAPTSGRTGVYNTLQQPSALQRASVSPAAIGGMTQQPAQDPRITPTPSPMGGYAGPTSRVGGAWGQAAYGGPTNRLAVNWDYQSSPEYQFRLAEAQKALQRQLGSRGRLDSTYGYDILGRQASQIAGEEVDKQYGRALGAEATNYGRGFQEEGIAYGRGVDLGERNLNREQINYGRGVGEEQTRYGREQFRNQEDYNRYLQANQINYGRGFQEEGRDYGRQFQLGEQDWMRNMQLANLAFQASNPQYGASYGNALGNLYNQQGQNLAYNAQQQGAVQGNLLQSLLNSGYTYLQAQEMMRQMPQQQAPGIPEYAQGYNPGAGAGPGYVPPMQAPNMAGVGGPSAGQYQASQFNPQVGQIGQYGNPVNYDPYQSQYGGLPGAGQRPPSEQVDVTLKF